MYISIYVYVYPSKQKASGMVHQRDWWRVAGFIMEKPEKHGLVHNGKARKTRPCYSWEILETTRGCSHSGPPDCWRAFQKYCFSSPDFAFCHALILTVIPGRVSGVMAGLGPVFCLFCTQWRRVGIELARAPDGQKAAGRGAGRRTPMLAHRRPRRRRPRQTGRRRLWGTGEGSIQRTTPTPGVSSSASP